MKNGSYKKDVPWVLTFSNYPNFVSPMGHIKKMTGEEDERRLGI
jgi:hypothetical protein